jgi:hypothetical protein
MSHLSLLIATAMTSKNFEDPCKFMGSVHVYEQVNGDDKAFYGTLMMTLTSLFLRTEMVRPCGHRKSSVVLAVGVDECLRRMEHDPHSEQLLAILQHVLPQNDGGDDGVGFGLLESATPEGSVPMSPVFRATLFAMRDLITPGGVGVFEQKRKRSHLMSAMPVLVLRPDPDDAARVLIGYACEQICPSLTDMIVIRMLVSGVGRVSAETHPHMFECASADFDPALVEIMDSVSLKIFLMLKGGCLVAPYQKELVNSMINCELTSNAALKHYRNPNLERLRSESISKYLEKLQGIHRHCTETILIPANAQDKVYCVQRAQKMAEQLVDGTTGVIINIGECTSEDPDIGEFVVVEKKVNESEAKMDQQAEKKADRRRRGRKKRSQARVVKPEDVVSKAHRKEVHRLQREKRVEEAASRSKKKDATEKEAAATLLSEQVRDCQRVKREVHAERFVAVHKELASTLFSRGVFVTRTAHAKMTIELRETIRPHTDSLEAARYDGACAAQRAASRSQSLREELRTTKAELKNVSAAHIETLEASKHQLMMCAAAHAEACVHLKELHVEKMQAAKAEASAHIKEIQAAKSFYVEEMQAAKAEASAYIKELQIAKSLHAKEIQIVKGEMLARDASQTKELQAVKAELMAEATAYGKEMQAIKQSFASKFLHKKGVVATTEVAKLRPLLSTTKSLEESKIELLARDVSQDTGFETVEAELVADAAIHAKEIPAIEKRCTPETTVHDGSQVDSRRTKVETLCKAFKMVSEALCKQFTVASESLQEESVEATNEVAELRMKLAKTKALVKRHVEKHISMCKDFAMERKNFQKALKQSNFVAERTLGEVSVTTLRNIMYLCGTGMLAKVHPTSLVWALEIKSLLIPLHVDVVQADRFTYTFDGYPKTMYPGADPGARIVVHSLHPAQVVLIPASAPLHHLWLQNPALPKECIGVPMLGI